ncbi:MAG TPA: hypothetical protein DD738_13520, partial [Ruminiclostridium sp.]|nr:hypothetical protein [Ruminiclostridium sp.]
IFDFGNGWGSYYMRRYLMETDIETVRRIADLAALSMKEEELDGYVQDLNIIIGYMNQLSTIDTGDTKPMEHILALQNVFREDIPDHSNRREELMKSASETKNGCYIVPSVVES